jgi:hypothetical protein
MAGKRMRNPVYPLLLPGLLAGCLAGCGPAGPEVRLAPEAAGWSPTRVAMLAPVVRGDATGTLKSLPEGLAMPTREEAGGRSAEAFEAALRSRGLTVTLVTASLSEGAGEAEKLSGQYLDTRGVDPATAGKVGEAAGADAVLMLAVLRYGPETDSEMQQMSQNANAKVGTTDLAISSTATRTVVWFNAHLRAALVRASDGLVVWDAAMRVRKKRGPLGDVSLDTVVRDAGAGLASVFPWTRQEEEAAPPAAGQAAEKE